jgi:hypothetical protein
MILILLFITLFNSVRFRIQRCFTFGIILISYVRIIFQELTLRVMAIDFCNFFKSWRQKLACISHLLWNLTIPLAAFSPIWIFLLVVIN